MDEIDNEKEGDAQVVLVQVVVCVPRPQCVLKRPVVAVLPVYTVHVKDGHDRTINAQWFGTWVFSEGYGCRLIPRRKGQYKPADKYLPWA